MVGYPVPANEAARLSALADLEIIQSPQEPQFDSVVTLACRIFDVPIALVSLVDASTQWFKACCGIDVCSTDRDLAFCNYVVAAGELVVVKDALSDPRFQDNPLVTGPPFIRFYAGAPLSIDPGLVLGTLCIIDTKPRNITPIDLDQLRQLAEIVMTLLRQRRDGLALERIAANLHQKGKQISQEAAVLARTKDLFDRASALTKTGAWEWRREGDDLTWSPGMYDLHDLPPSSKIEAARALSFYSAKSRHELERLFARSKRENNGYSFEGELITAQGRRRWIRLTANVEIENGSVVSWYGVMQDISEQKSIFDKMQFLADRDTLTGLANRSSFRKEVETFQTDADAHPPLSLLLIDLDGFKHVNDTFGHPVGDACLKTIARRLPVVCPKARLIARLGGDEFAILLDTNEPEVLAGAAQAILAAVRRPVRRLGQSFQLSASIGVTSLDARNGRFGDLFAEADLALYAAKDSGRNTSRFYTLEMKAKAEDRFQTVRSITKALDERQLELFYQPKIDLRRGDDLAGFEALLRWRRPDGKVVTAGGFAAALEDPELSDRIGVWVIRECLRQARAWHDAGLAFGHIAINLSSGQFRESDFAERFIEQIRLYGLRPDMIEVEVTEGVFLNHEAGQVNTILRMLRSAGIRIALDDFGTGYASLSHLRSYPVDIIKIDRSFVQHFLTSSQDHAILQSMIFLARHLELDLVAEGIEEVEQCEFLKALGCQFGQGYYFSKAVCAEEAAEWCRPKQVSHVA